MNTLSPISLQNLQGVHPDLVRVIKSAIMNCPIDFRVVEGVRTAARQRELYAQGRTKPGNIVTYADGVVKKSNHQLKADGYGHAVDIYPFFGGKVQFNAHKELDIIAKHILSIAQKLGVQITWGGYWKKPVDKPHYQIL